MDEYAELHFIERNANDHDHRRRPSSSGRPGRTFIPAPRYHVQVPAQPQVVYAQAPAMGLNASNVFGKMTTGQVIDVVAQIFAALMPLPAAPVATKDATTDVGNLILYQGSLAQYAKRDEQVRTLGNLITKLVG